MNRVDLHPEELVDALRRDGTLGPADRTRLEEHLDACAPCAFEQAAVRDFTRKLDRDEPGDAAAAAGALAGALADPRVASRVASGARGGWAAPRRRGRLLLVAAILLAATAGAAATAWYALVVIGRRAEPVEPSACPPGESGLAGSVVYSAPDAATPPAAGASARSGTPVAPVPAPEAVVEPPSASSAPPQERPVRSPVLPVADVGAAPVDDATALFSRANAARRARDYGTAAAAYDELGRRYAGSREELLARVTYGKLLLDVLAQPQRALGLFDSYLAAERGGTMAEEALVGRAVALGRLGRAAEERGAWQALLAEFPDSTHAERARRRLEELE